MKKVCGYFFTVLVLIPSFSYGSGGTFSLCRRFLADADLETRLLRLHGGDPLAPTPNSRLGRYLSESKAITFLYSFPVDPFGGRREKKKLVVLVSPQSFETFKKYFGHTYPNILEHLHTPNQGTLILRWGDWTTGRSDNTGQLNFREEWRFPSPGSLGIMIHFSDSEAQRIANYFEMTNLGDDTNNDNDADNVELSNPSTIRGFHYPRDFYLGNCTAWCGHIPVGDQRVRRVTSPGNRDGAPSQWGRARTSTLHAYPNSSLEGYSDRERRIIRRVWAPSLHQPLFELLGIPLRLANHTNPGWVALTLTGLVGNDRVPFVVLYTHNHRTVPELFDPQINPVGP